MKQVIKHRDGGLLNMIRRTDPDDIISDDMPSDFRDPDRLNNIDTKEKNSSTMEDFLRMIKNIYFHK